MRNNARLVTFVKQATDAFFSTLTVIERQFVDPHRDKSVCDFGSHVTCELHRVLERILTVFHRVHDALMEVTRDPLYQIFAEVALDRISAHRQRKTGSLVPPFTEIEDLVHPELFIKKLAFVN